MLSVTGHETSSSEYGHAAQITGAVKALMLRQLHGRDVLGRDGVTGMNCLMAEVQWKFEGQGLCLFRAPAGALLSCISLHLMLPGLGMCLELLSVFVFTSNRRQWSWKNWCGGFLLSLIWLPAWAHCCLTPGQSQVIKNNVRGAEITASNSRQRLTSYVGVKLNNRQCGLSFGLWLIPALVKAAFLDTIYEVCHLKCHPGDTASHESHGTARVARCGDNRTQFPADPWPRGTACAMPWPAVEVPFSSTELLRVAVGGSLLPDPTQPHVGHPPLLGPVLSPRAPAVRVPSVLVFLWQPMFFSFYRISLLFISIEEK